MRSIANTVSGRPAPRYGAFGVLLVTTPRHSTARCGHAMGPEQVRHRVVRQHDAPARCTRRGPPRCGRARRAWCRRAARRSRCRAPGARAWAEPIMCSRRSSVHFTGRRARDGGRGDQEVLRVAVGLGAEAAAHVGGDHAHLVGGQAERGHQPLLDEVDDLRAVPGGERCRRARPTARPRRASRSACRRSAGRRSARAPARRPRGRPRRRRRSPVVNAHARRCRPTPGGAAARPARAAATMSTTGGQRLVVHLDQLGGVLGQRAAVRQRPWPRSRRRGAPRPGTSRAGAPASWSRRRARRGPAGPRRTAAAASSSARGRRR